MRRRSGRRIIEDSEEGGREVEIEGGRDDGREGGGWGGCRL